MGILIALIPTLFTIIREGVLTYVQVQGILQKYASLEPTPANIELARVELLNAAKLTHAVDDPRIRAMLEAEGIDPETLRIG